MGFYGFTAVIIPEIKAKEGMYALWHMKKQGNNLKDSGRKEGGLKKERD
ncbi:MAG: hypothetical protein SVV67_11035 [Bacillota bacterium]|nr:hypothetical protein [Bacillota bacterium]